MEPLAVRFKPGQDILLELERIAQEREIEAACVLTCVGSLTLAVLRFANQEEPTELNGHFEIVSLTGVLSCHGSHFHIAISDQEGKTTGAHLLPGSKVYTTAEIVLAVLPRHSFLRTFDPQTGYPELEIKYLTSDEE
ncbi:PPC domain-containing DNA-binding protein [Desulfovibrio sp. JC022]|uniref:PPC domain-containing DNA-binding protein n=1 Tax=Desulfovibrio sp. JC022 TaxID=2593642 RepID=UPI0013D47E48|nr:PPC domain-containing DNA-binding protein [Desulfovibrio sp. JC022]NDV22312.1 DNA-binding protein [Desulfovibrio sp. JC022]